MSIRAILVHLDSAKQTQARVATAAELALRHEAHLIGLAPTGRVVMPMERAAVLGLGAYEESAMRSFRARAQICHGVKVEAKHVPAKVAAGEALLRHAARIDADLIVAGGHGHSRLRQSILGGVTRTLLRSSPVPALLSH